MNPIVPLVRARWNGFANNVAGPRRVHRPGRVAIGLSVPIKLPRGDSGLRVFRRESRREPGLPPPSRRLPLIGDVAENERRLPIGRYLSSVRAPTEFSLFVARDQIERVIGIDQIRSLE